MPNHDGCQPYTYTNFPHSMLCDGETAHPVQSDNNAYAKFNQLNINIKNTENLNMES